MTKNKVPDKESVNGLIRKAFGIGFSGDWREFISLNPYFPGKIIKHVDRLNDIARKIPPFPFPSCFSALDARGKFLNQDGSELIVFPEDISKAKKYAELYENKFEKKVKISIYDTD